MKEQAERDITSRYPAPVRLRLPGFVRMLPDTPVGINELIPGAWSYVRATRTCRKVSQWQKLDEVTVNEVNGVETVSVSLTQAPSKIVDP